MVRTWTTVTEQAKQKECGFGCCGHVGLSLLASLWLSCACGLQQTFFQRRVRRYAARLKAFCLCVAAEAD